MSKRRHVSVQKKRTWQEMKNRTWAVPGGEEELVTINLYISSLLCVSKIVFKILYNQLIKLVDSIGRRM